MPINYHIRKKQNPKKNKVKKHEEETHQFHLVENFKTEEAKNVLDDYSSSFFFDGKDHVVTEPFDKNDHFISDWCKKGDLPEENNKSHQYQYEKKFQRNWREKSEQSLNQQKKVKKAQIFILESPLLEVKRKSSVKSASCSVKYINKSNQSEKINKKERNLLQSKVINLKAENMNYQQKDYPLHSNNQILNLKNRLGAMSSIKVYNGSGTKIDIIQNRRNLDITMLMKKYRKKQQQTKKNSKTQKLKRYSPNGYIINNYLSGKYPSKLKAMMNIKDGQSEKDKITSQSNSRMLRKNIFSLKKIKKKDQTDDEKEV